MKRVVRSRQKGWRKPENTVCIDRATRYGNQVRLVGDCIYIDAGYRRNILDKWVFLQIGDINDVLRIYESLFCQDAVFENLDLQHWQKKCVH